MKLVISIFLFVLPLFSWADDWAPVDQVTLKGSSLSVVESGKKVGRWSLGIGSSLISNMTSANGKYSSNANGSFDVSEAEVEFSRSPSFVLEYSRVAPYSWGYSAGIQYDTPASFKKDKITLNDRVSEASLPEKYAPKLQTTVLSAAGVYRMQNFYLPLGINYSIPYYDKNKMIGSFSAKGGFGFQFGFGYEFESSVALETTVRSLALELSEKGRNYSLEYGEGRLYTGNLGLKYFF